MGWASTFEDIVERLTHDVEIMRQAKEDAIPDGRSVERGEAVIRTCENALVRLQEFMDLATDPDFDCAAKCKDLEGEVQVLKHTVSDHRIERDAEREMRVRVERKLHVTETKLVEATYQVEKLTKKIENSASHKRLYRLEKRLSDQTAQLEAKDKEITKLKSDVAELKNFRADPEAFYDAYPPPPDGE